MSVAKENSESGKDASPGAIQKSMAVLADEWAVFLRIFLSPLILALIAVTVFLLYSAYAFDSDDGSARQLQTILSALASVLSSVAGALIWQRWSDVSDQGVLVTRGKSAIRGLKLLLLNLTSTESRIRIHKERMESIEDFDEVVANALDEMIARCNSLQEEAMNAIEEWEDIIPEANIKSQLDIISDLRSRAEELEREKIELSKNSRATVEEKDSLIGQLEKKDQELKNVRAELRSRKLAINSSVLSGLTEPSVLENLGRLPHSSNETVIVLKCDQCGEHVNVTSRERGSGKDLDSCPKCGGNIDLSHLMIFHATGSSLPRKSRFVDLSCSDPEIRDFLEHAIRDRWMPRRDKREKDEGSERAST